MSSVEKPPVTMQAWVFTVAGTPVPNGSDITIDLQKGNVGPTSSVRVHNDNAAGGSDMFYTFNGANAAAPADGITATNVAICKPGESITFDGRWTTIILRGSSAVCAARVEASYG